jgi:hypothetical protein
MPQKTKRRTRKKTRQKPHTQNAPNAPNAVKEEHHSYYSKMSFDGQNLITESKKDNEPIKRKVYTMKELKKEIPIGAELLENENLPVPKALQYPIPKEIGFRTVLPNPADLGLLPPSPSDGPTTIHMNNVSHRNESSRCHRLRSNRLRSRCLRNRNHSRTHHYNGDNDIKLIIQDRDQKPHILFDLPPS